MTIEENENEENTVNNVETNTEQKGKEGASNDNNRGDDFDGLSNRDAIKKAIQVHREGKPADTEPQKASETPTKAEVKQDLADDLEPPSGFNKQEIEAWKAKDMKGIMQGYTRLSKLRQQATNQALTDRDKAYQEVKPWKDLDPVVKPYIEARQKEGVTMHQAVKEALDLVVALRNGKPDEVKKALEQAKINLDESSGGEKKFDDSPLQNRIQTLEQIIERQETSKLASAYDQVFRELGALKTRAGNPAFPEFTFQPGDENGNQLAAAIGSSTRDPAFIAGVRRRIPDADFKTVVLEAYKFHGGKVAGAPIVEASQNDNQKHFERARRAASSAPARQASRNDKSSMIGKLSNTAAIKQALIDHRER